MGVTTMSDSERSVETPPETPPVPEPRTIPATELFQGNSEVLIEHRGEIYRLIITNRRRLILKK